MSWNVEDKKKYRICYDFFSCQISFFFILERFRNLFFVSLFQLPEFRIYCTFLLQPYFFCFPNFMQAWCNYSDWEQKLQKFWANFSRKSENLSVRIIILMLYMVFMGVKNREDVESETWVFGTKTLRNFRRLFYFCRIYYYYFSCQILFIFFELYPGGFSGI